LADISKEISRMTGTATSDLKDQNTAAWREFIEGWAEVSILGPKEVVAAAQELHDALADMVAKTDHYLATSQWSAEANQQYNRFEDQRVKARDAFRRAAGATVAVSSGVVPD